MYVCNCNGITERQVKAAVEAGAENWTDVHFHHGCRAQCGKCGVDIAGYINPVEKTDSVSLIPPLAAEA